MTMASTTTLNASDSHSGGGDNGDSSTSFMSATATAWSRNSSSDLYPAFLSMSHTKTVGCSATNGTPFAPSCFANFMLNPNTIPSTVISTATTGLAAFHPRGGVETTKVAPDTVGKYATVLLQRNSPEELRSSIDESLGPYITSILTEFIRSSSSTTTAAKRVLESSLEDAWIDYENVLELILEHCSMTSRDVASQTLLEIYRAVRTGIVPFQFTEERESYMEPQQNFMLHGILNSISDINISFVTDANTHHRYHQPQTSQHQDYDAKDVGDAEFEMLVGQIMFQEQDTEEEEVRNDSSATKLAAKNKEELNSRLPSYLLDEAEESEYNTDGPSDSNNSPVNHINTSSLSNSPNSTISINGDTAIINNKCHPPRPSKSGNISVKEKKKRNKAADDMLAKDVAAALFKPSRPRSNSNLSDTTTGKRNNSITNTTTASPKLMPQAAMSTTPPSNVFLMDNSRYYFSSGTCPQQQDHYQHSVANQIDATAELLLSMQSDLSTNAALTASVMAYGDVNIAYYLIELATNAPPICRHMLQYACYRADCAFSHDVDGHTCTFWLKGRCGKGDSCRFLHGFNKALLEGLIEPMDQSSSTAGLGGITDHQQQQQVQQEDLPSSSCSTGGGAIVTQNLLWHNEKQKKDSSTATRSGSPFLTSSSPPPGLLPLDPFEINTCSLQQKLSTADTSNTSTISFAKVAASSNILSISSTSASAPATATITCGGKQKEKVIKIPQELWTSTINRDSSLFQIADPIERYNAVNNAQTRAKQTTAGLPHIMNLHFQSVKTAHLVLSTILPQKLEESLQHAQHELTQAVGVWILTSSGHHVNTQSHQKRNGELENSVLKWLQDEGYEYFRGKDRNGNGGAIYVTAMGTLI